VTLPPLTAHPELGDGGAGAPGTPVRPAGDVHRTGDIRLRWGASVSAAIVVTLVRPASWAFGLLAFLAGGGLALIAWPIVVLPTPTGLQNALGNPISSLVFGAPSQAMLGMLVAGLAGLVVLVAVALLLGSWAARLGIGIVVQAAADEAIVAPAPDLDGAPGAGRIAVVRLLGLVPLGVALLLAWRHVYDVTYRELVLPTNLVTPLPVRVLGQVPWVVVGVIAAWLAGDAAASVGVRRLVIERRPVLAAWLLGWADLVRRAHRVIPTALVGLGVLLLLTAPGLAAAALAWARVRDVLVGGADPGAVVVALVVWVATWLGTLVLAGVGAAFRSAAWTLELPRRRRRDR
jgi:hypothetical protein